MPDPVHILVSGAPVSKGRPRVTRAGFAFTPAHTRKYESHVRMAAQLEMQGREPLEGSLVVEVDAYLPIPTSWSQKRQRLAAQGLIRPVTRPDIDNLGKAGLDACNTIVWRDDSQIADLRIRKIYARDPRLEIAVRPLDLTAIEVAEVAPLFADV